MYKFVLCIMVIGSLGAAFNAAAQEVQLSRSAGIPEATAIEVRVFRALNAGLANPVLDAVMPPLTDFNRSRIFVILAWAALVIFGKSRGRWAALVLIPVIAASDQISSSIMKHLVERARPCEVLGNVHLWWGSHGWIWTPEIVTQSYKGSPAFPSSHAANITASMLFLGLVYRRFLVPLLVLALLVGYSRIYIGVHWPSDVLGGTAIGALIAFLAYWLFRKLYRGAAADENATTDEDAAAGATPRAPDTPPSE